LTAQHINRCPRCSWRDTVKKSQFWEKVCDVSLAYSRPHLGQQDTREEKRKKKHIRGILLCHSNWLSSSAEKQQQNKKNTRDLSNWTP
jgi:hypothetical protein